MFECGGVAFQNMSLKLSDASSYLLSTIIGARYGPSIAHLKFKCLKYRSLRLLRCNYFFLDMYTCPSKQKDKYFFTLSSQQLVSLSSLSLCISPPTLKTTLATRFQVAIVEPLVCSGSWWPKLQSTTSGNRETTCCTTGSRYHPLLSSRN